MIGDAKLHAVEEKEFRNVLERLLFPLLPGTEFDTSVRNVKLPTRNKDLLATTYSNGTKLKLMPGKDSKYCVQVSRKQTFTTEEVNLVRDFLKHATRIYQDLGKAYLADTESSVMTEVVTSYLYLGPIAHSIISTLSSWAQETYEGQKIAFSAGIDLQAHSGETAIAFDELAKHDFTKVLSNGSDTLLVFDKNGGLLDHAAVRGLPLPSTGYYCPVQYSATAAWTKTRSYRYAISLNRSGEIMIFSIGSLLFAKRRGAWRFFSHETATKQFSSHALANRTSSELRCAIYHTALDVSFARCGGCLAVIREMDLEQFSTRQLVQAQDRFGGNNCVGSEKREALEMIVRGRDFESLDRQLRMELLAIDGATVLDHSGKVLAVGAILAIPGGSGSGGGREAAARALAKYGLAIKISNDGYIKVFNRLDKVIMELA